MKKGFTLIELLAVIVILAIIAVIAVPIVLNIINDSKENALKRSADFYVDAVEYSIAGLVTGNQSLPDGKYQVLSNGNICIGTIVDEVCDKELKVEVNGEKPTSGIVTIESGSIKKYELTISNTIIAKPSTPESLYGAHIGEEVAYNAGISSYTGKWHILGTEDDQLLIVSDSIGTLQLSGAEGYNNGVALLDGMADDYGNGKGAESARSLRVEDINKITGYKPEKVDVTKAPYASGTLEEYGNKVTFEVKDGLVVKTGLLNGTYNDGVDKPTTFRKLNGQELVNNSGETYTVTNNYYDYIFGYRAWDSSKNTHITEDTVLPNTQVFKVISENLHLLLNRSINTGDEYWLANQSILGGSKSASWGIMSFHYNGENSTVHRDFLYNSNPEAGSSGNGTGTYTWHVRSVVKLKKGVKLYKNANGIWEIG